MPQTTNDSSRIPSANLRTSGATTATRLIALSVVLGTLACGREPEALAPVVAASSARALPAGNVVGFGATRGGHAWRGLPFALAPVGERRWRSPAPAARWNGTRDALDFGSPCSQLATPFAGVVDQEPGSYAGSEDCLYLNVYAPGFEPEAVPRGADRLPVMVWIHGGGNSVGHASFYNGGPLANSQDVVVVTINYRLGPFGWFRHASLRSSAADAIEASGNFGILDQIQALTWVRENIAAFGGDPGNVTIFGESAGGRNVIALVLSPLAKDLFHRAIVQSGSARALPFDDAEDFADAAIPGLENSSNEILARLLIEAGQANNRDTAVAKIGTSTAGEIESFLRSVSPAKLLQAYVTDDMEGIPRVPNVFGDGIVIPTAPPLERLATAGAFNDVPIIFGTNRDEAKIFMFASPVHTRQLLGILPRLRNPDAFNAEANAATLAWRLGGAEAPADAMIKAGATEVFVYRWDWDEEPSLLGSDFAMMIGASHAFEIPFIFDHYDLGPRANIVWTNENRRGRDLLSKQMMSYWTQFARTGNPGRGRDGDQTEWSPWQTANDAPQFMVLDTPTDGGLRMSSEVTSAADIMQFVKSDPRLETVRCKVASTTSATLEGVGEPAYRIDGCAVPEVAAR